MSDELQAAVTSASEAPEVTLNNDTGMNDEAQTETTTEMATQSDDVESKEAESNEQEADAVEDTSRNRQPLSKKEERQRMANRRQQETIKELQAKIAKFEESAPVQESNKAPQAPNIDDYNSYEDYEKDRSAHQEELVKFEAERLYNERTEKEQAERAEQEQAAKMQERENAFRERENQFKARHKNYDRNAQALVEALQYLPEESMESSKFMGEYITNSELAPNLIHHLGANPDLVEDLASRDFVGVIKGLHTIELSLEKTPAGSKKLPEPISKIAPSNKGGKSLTDMSWDEMSKRLNLS